jgi:hypothetical protein
MHVNLRLEATVFPQLGPLTQGWIKSHQQMIIPAYILDSFLHVSHTTGISAWIFPVRVLHLQETGDCLGWRPTCVIRHMTFHPTGSVGEGN